jgi:hypothetical protein
MPALFIAPFPCVMLLRCGFEVQMEERVVEDVIHGIKIR